MLTLAGAEGGDAKEARRETRERVRVAVSGQVARPRLPKWGPDAARGTGNGWPRRRAIHPGHPTSVAEDAENFRCGGGLLDYVQILYGNKGSQQKYGLEVPQMKKNT